MKTVRAALTLAFLASLAGCGSQPPGQDKVIIVGMGDLSPETPPPPPALAAEAARDDDGRPELAPPLLEPEAERGEKGARNVLLAFARALELREWGQAWAMLDENSKARWPTAIWREMFADLRSVTVRAPEGTIEGAAGSSYYTAPLVLTGEDRAGRPLRYEGEVVLRRVNDVPGAAPAQLRWHMERLTLDRTQ